ncbi:hypothetical protein KI387_000269, partial [Taxus chinensis]
REEAKVIARFEREEEIRAQLEEIARLQATTEERVALAYEEAKNRNKMADNEHEAHTPNVPWGRNT